MISTPERQRFVEAGRAGARRRWGPPRILRLDELTPQQRRLVESLLAAFEAEATDPRRGSGDAA